MSEVSRKTATEGYDRNGAVKGASGQGERPMRKTASEVSKSTYVRKPAGVSPSSLPHRKTADGSAPSK